MLLLALAAAAAPATAGPFEDGLEAASRGDYAEALKLWRPLAEQGNAYAQYNLGVMYDNGWGVAQDYAEAERWYRLAADQGNARA
ncbi:MAG: SEL1-like repeat protein, partial [Alphaproteobacteria bacterium]|nr:SEL1-like repeat protein [Alphaproteobacteria bacterium]